MFVLIGYVLMLGAIFGAYTWHGGHLFALWQPAELVMIAGGGAGALLVGYGSHLKSILSALPTVLSGRKYSKSLYMDLFALLYELLSKIRKEGLMSIEQDVEEPEKSPVFNKYPRIGKNHHLVDFITDYMRLMVGGNLNAFEIENLMDNEIETHHHESSVPVNAMAKLGDALPAFGIVAAVMGVVHAMGSLYLPPVELGALIGAALVGTFLGILLSYGFVTPLSTVLEIKADESTKVFQTIKVTLLASLNGYAPQIAVEFGRKVLYSSERPSFKELEDHVKQRRQ